MALGAGSLPEEVFGVCIRSDCPTVRMLRKRALKNFMGLKVASAELSKFIDATNKVVKRIGYVPVYEAVRDVVVKEYAKVLELDIPPSEDSVSLVGGQPGQTLEELIYRSDDPLVDALHEALVMLYMEYVDRADWRQLDVLDFAAYAALELLRRGRMVRGKATELLKQITDQALSAA
jgi:hypothetical protein